MKNPGGEFWWNDRKIYVGYSETPYERNPMKNYKKTVMITDNLMIDDHIKVAGVLYRITHIQRIGRAYVLEFHNVHRPKIEGLLTVETNTLVHVWNQK